MTRYLWRDGHVDTGPDYGPVARRLPHEGRPLDYSAAAVFDGDLPIMPLVDVHEFKLERYAYPDPHRLHGYVEWSEYVETTDLPVPDLGPVPTLEELRTEAHRIALDVDRNRRGTAAIPPYAFNSIVWKRDGKRLQCDLNAEQQAVYRFMFDARIKLLERNR